MFSPIGRLNFFSDIRLKLVDSSERLDTPIESM